MGLLGTRGDGAYSVSDDQICREMSAHIHACMPCNTRLACCICAHASTCSTLMQTCVRVLSSSLLSEVPPPVTSSVLPRASVPPNYVSARWLQALSHCFAVNCRLIFSALSLLAPLGSFVVRACIHHLSLPSALAFRPPVSDRQVLASAVRDQAQSGAVCLHGRGQAAACADTAAVLPRCTVAHPPVRRAVHMLIHQAIMMAPQTSAGHMSSAEGRSPQRCALNRVQ